METNPPKLNPKPTWLEIAMGAAILIGVSLTVVPRFSQAADRQRLEGLSDANQLQRIGQAFQPLTVVPRFSQAADRQRLEGLSDALQLIRCTIDLYRAEHDGLYPGQRAAGESVSPMEFVQELTLPGTDGRFPYFQRFPDNPFIYVNDCRNTVTCVNDPNIRPNGKEGTAWWFNAATGEFRACDNEFHTAY